MTPSAMLEQCYTFCMPVKAIRGRPGGLKGGPKGGRARARALSSARRREIAQQAAAVRWEGRLPAGLRWLFWEYNFDELRLPEHHDLLMLKVLTYGGRQERTWLRRRFGDPAIRKWLYDRRGHGLTPEQMVPWVPARTAWSWHDPNTATWSRR
jgi:hypothetical protein